MTWTLASKIATKFLTSPRVKAILGSSVRHALTAEAGWLAAHGLLDPTKEETWVAAALLLLGWGWGLVEKAARES
ncbi:MAG TPA: hypothetical protein PLU30_17890 [Verrucomicrobiae bacterium]|nr:hypothetical protein [Verrucomicrobiae bacterium]